MKKVSKIIVVIFMSLAFFGCGSVNSIENAMFSEFIDGLPARLAGTNGFDLNYSFNDPSAFGIEKEVGSIAAFTMDEYVKSIVEMKELLEELEAFDYNTLTTNQQLDYDILFEYLERQLLLEGYEYFNNNYLGSFLGVQAQLPVLLLEFQLQDKQDLETYLHVLKTAPEVFQGYADNEKVRQENGTGMSQVLLDVVIEQCDNFASGDVAFLIEAMNQKIDDANFLSYEEKEEAKSNNESYTNNEFRQAYVNLKAELEAITPEMEDGGIAQQENGKAYYEALFQFRCGLDWTIAQLEAYLDDKEEEYFNFVLQKVMADPSLQTTMFEQSYGDFASVEETIDYLAKVYLEYFPEVEKMQYRVVDVPKSMQDNFSPAAYLTSRIDRKDEEPLLILINGRHENTDFTTIAHEGYPGHMYQDNYFQQLDVSTFRYLLGCMGYTEGWATYIEGKTHWFTKEDNADILEVFESYQKITHAVMAKWDIQINYHGISREEFKRELEGMYGEGVFSEADANAQYNLILENPTNYLMYFVNGLYFTDLYNEAKETLGGNFDPIAFHQVLLDIGPVGMSLLTKQVEEYIEENNQ
jgi:uncharacterized protein (DUF885 family)